MLYWLKYALKCHLHISNIAVQLLNTSGEVINATRRTPVFIETCCYLSNPVPSLCSYNFRICSCFQWTFDHDL